MKSSAIYQTLFAPLDKRYCTYYLAISVISFVLLILTALSGVIHALIQYSNSNGRSFGVNLVPMLSINLNLFILYFVNRLMYSICARSLA